MKTRLILAGLLVLIITFFTFIQGCKTPPQQTSANKLVVWHWMTDRKEAFDALASKYKKLTGIDVEFKLLFPPGTYSMKVTAAARAKTLPDIFGILGEKETVATFIRAQHITNLTPYMTENSEEWKKRFYPQTLSVSTFKSDNSSRVPA
ncbi:MAG: extracellular solute-binding protein, partial [Candidatus Omnitrophica bacterium]|nr:extracellular solute-binding protein [Candidatus Omnitrophota bacterium]